MGKIKNFLIWFKGKYFLLNQKQREHVSKICHTLGLVAAMPLIIKILSNEQSSDDWLAAVGVIYAIIFEVLAIAALTAKEDK